MEPKVSKRGRRDFNRNFKLFQIYMDLHQKLQKSSGTTKQTKILWSGSHQTFQNVLRRYDLSLHSLRNGTNSLVQFALVCFQDFLLPPPLECSEGSSEWQSQLGFIFVLSTSDLKSAVKPWGRGLLFGQCLMCRNSYS